MGDRVKVKAEVGGDINSFIGDLENYKDHIEEISRRAIYDGAKVLADQIRKSIEKLDTSGRTKDYEVDGLLDGLGVTPMKQNSQRIDAKIGMHGYNKHKTTKYPQGQPNAMIARSIESGTSFRRAQPFIAPTVSRYKDQAEHAMSEEFDRQTRKYMKEEV